MKEWEQDDWKMKETERKGIKEGIDEVWKNGKKTNTEIQMRRKKKRKAKRKGKKMLV